MNQFIILNNCRMVLMKILRWPCYSSIWDPLMRTYCLCDINLTTVIYPCASAHAVHSARNVDALDRAFGHWVKIFFSELGLHWTPGPHWLGCDRLPSGVLPRLSRDRAVLMHWGGLIKSFGSSICFPQQSELSAEESPEKLGTSQLHHHKVISLNKQILQKTKQLEEVSVFFS